MRGLTFCLVVILLLASIAAGQTHSAEKVGELTGKFERELGALAAALDGVAGVGIKDLATGYEFYLNPDEVFPQASVIKIPVLLKLFEEAQAGRLRLDQAVTVRAAEFVPGSGILRELGDGSVRLSLDDLAVLMIVLSDNTATNILIDRVGGLAAVNAMLDRLGLPHTRLNRKLGVFGAEGRTDSTSTPREMVLLLEKLERGELLGPALTQRVLEILKKEKESALRAGLPKGVSVANKTGSLPGVRCDSGIIYLQSPDAAPRAYILTVNTTYLRNDEDGEKFIREVSRLVYDYFSRLARSNPYGRRLP